MSAKLYDYENKGWVEVPDGEVTKLVGDGTHGFEDGIEIPVVAPDGSHGSIPSHQAAEFFAQGGFRWRTMQDAYETEAAENLAAEKARYDNQNMAVDAFATGAMSGYTFGGSDVVMRGAAELMGKGEAYTDARKKMQDYNAGVYTAGKVVGTVASPVNKLISPLGKGVEAFVKAPLGREIAAAGLHKALQTTVAKGLGSAVEGAFYGLGEGVSEASLGKPEEVGEHIFANVANGLIFGTAMGPLFAVGEAAQPSAKFLAGKIIEGGSELAQGASRQFVDKIVAPVMSLTGEKEQAALVKGLSTKNAMKARHIWQTEGREAAEKWVAEVGPLEGQVKSAQEATKAELEAALKGEPAKAREQIQSAYADAQGSVYETSAALEAAHAGKKLELDQALDADVVPSSTFKYVQDETRATIARLRGEGSQKSLSLAKQLENQLAAREAAHGISAEGVQSQQFTEGMEMKISRDLRETATRKPHQYNSEAQKIIADYQKTISSHLYGNQGGFGPQFRELDQLNQSYQIFQKAVGKGAKGAQSFIQSLVNDPRAAREFEAISTVFSEVAPHIEAVFKAGENVKAREAALDALMARAAEVKGSLKDLTVDEWDQLVREFGVPDIGEKVARLRELEQSMAGTNAAERAIQMKRVLGHDVDKELQMLADNDQAFKSLRRLDELGAAADDDQQKSLLVRASRRVGQAAGAAVGGKVGWMGGPVLGGLGGAMGASMGGKAGATVGGLMKKATNPARIINTLSTLERAAQKSAARLEKFTGEAIDALTSEAVGRRAATATATFGIDLVHDREGFKERAERIAQLSHPQQMAEFAAAKFAGLEGAPNIQAALTAQLSTAVQYLQAKMPHDPLAVSVLNPFKSKWEPSDHELAKFERCLNVVCDPVYVLDRLKKGAALPEEVEALQVIHPGVFRRLQEGVMDAIMSPDVSLSYTQRIQLGTLLNIPADPTLETGFVTQMQANYAADQGGRPAGGGGGGGGGSSIPRPTQMNVSPEATTTQVQRTTDS